MLNITYYKLRAKKHFAYYIIGLGVESYRVGGTREFLNQTLTIPRGHCIRETMRKELKIVARMGLCSGQRCGNTMVDAMESNLPDVIWDVMQMGYQNSAPGVDESCRMVCG